LGDYNGYNGHSVHQLGAINMKTMTARDAKNHFGEFLDAARREPVIVTKNDRPVGIMISIEDAADTLIPEMFMEKEPGYDEWLATKVGATAARVESGAATLRPHTEALLSLKSRVEAKLVGNVQ
jgi:prevent-host-death family protein